MKKILLLSLVFLSFVSLSFYIGQKQGKRQLVEQARIEMQKCSDKNVCKVKSLNLVILPNGRVKDVSDKRR